MALTVKEISESLNVNKNKVYRAIEKYNLKPEFTNGVAKYDEQAVKMIRDEIKRIDKKKARTENEQRKNDPQPSSDQSDLVNALNETIRIQAETIDHLKTENNELRSMIKREQDIRLGQIMIEANNKPKLLERIKSRLFGRGDNQEVNEQE